MTDTSAPSRRSTSERPGDRGGRGFFGGIALFLRQIIDELRKVVRPTGPELVRYTMVVLAFVVFIMVLVAVMDLAFTKAISWVFTGKTN